MIPFFEAIGDNPFLLPGLLVGVLASVACGIIGPYVITRRIVFLAGAIAHFALCGVGAAILARHHLREHLRSEHGPAEAARMLQDDALLSTVDQLLPTLGALAAAVIGAIIIGLVQHRIRERVDTLIGAMWAIGMALGVMLVKLTPGYHAELMSYLFGSIAYVWWDEVWLIVVLDVVIIASVLLLHKRMLALCLDEEQAELQGVNVLLTNLMLLTLVALTVICLIRMVGLILVLALLTLPAATVGHYVNRLGPMILGSFGLCLLVTTVPRIAAYGSPISPEATIVLAAGGVYLLSVVVGQVFRVHWHEASARS
jgi:zinc transport system permease protein